MPIKKKLTVIMKGEQIDFTAIGKRFLEIMNRDYHASNITLETVLEGFNRLHKKISNYVEQTYPNASTQGKKRILGGLEEAAFGMVEHLAIGDNNMTTNEAKSRQEFIKIITNGAFPNSLSYNGDAIEALALARGRGKIAPYANILEVKGVSIFAPESALKLGTGAVKIYRYAVSEFTKRNHCNADDKNLKLRYILDVKDFAQANGVDTENPDAMKNFRRKLKDSLLKLKTASITWEEKIKGKPKSFAGVNYIGAYELKGNELMIEFTLSMAQYLASLPLIIYPRSLYALDDKDYNAYAIGEAMCIHCSQDNNVMRGTEGKLRVETLLKSTSYPSYEEIKANHWSWIEKVKDLFENALDKLTQCGLIADWVYCHEGGIELTDKEASKIIDKSYSYFTSLIVEYKLNDFEEHADRVTAIQERKAKRLERAKKARRRKKSDNKKKDANENEDGNSE